MAERRLWTDFEDNALKYLREECQLSKWSEISSKMIEIFSITDRNQKQCRDRYTNNLNPNLNLNNWKQSDELLLIQCHKKFGNKWTVIAEKFKGRTDSFIKNHFYSRLRKCIRKLNRCIEEEFKKKYKKLNLNIIFKLTNLVQDKLTKISQDVREFYEKLMYDLVSFSLKIGQSIQKQDQTQIQTFILALTSLENLSGEIGANRKPKRGRGHKKEQKYLISIDGLCLVSNEEDQLILRKEPNLYFEQNFANINQQFNENSQISASNNFLTGESDEDKEKARFSQKTLESRQISQANISQLQKMQIENGDCQKIGNTTIQNNENDKRDDLMNEQEDQQESIIINEHDNSNYTQLMDYIMQNSFDCGQQIISLSKQGSLQSQTLF